MHNSAQYWEINSTQHLIIGTFIGAVSRTAQDNIRAQILDVCA